MTEMPGGLWMAAIKPPAHSQVLRRAPPNEIAFCIVPFGYVAPGELTPALPYPK